MGDQLALPWLYRAVKARFAEDRMAVPVVFGWRQRAQRGEGDPRVLFTPGDDQDGSVGDVTAARYPGRAPARSLGTLNELFTVTIWAADKESPEDELAQYEACRFLFDAWYRAAYLVATDTLVVRDVSWVTDMKDRRYGAALRVLCSIQAMLPDACQPDASQGQDLKAEIASGYSEDEETTDTFEASGS
jgi:hypothetical protein